MGLSWIASVVFLVEKAFGRRSNGGTLACDQVKELLHTHNSIRREVASGTPGRLNLPRAENMLELRWNARLMREAQAHANGCQYRHDAGRKPNIGECLAGSHCKSDARCNLTELVYAWLDEKGDCRTAIRPGLKTMGCGLSECTAEEPLKDYFYRAFLVCRYYPYEEESFAEGPPDCNKHNLHESVRYPGLCSESSPEAQKAYEPCSPSGPAARPSKSSGGTSRAPPLSILSLILFSLKLK